MLKNEEKSARVTPDVPICVLRHSGPTSPFHPHVSTINETHPIALVGIEIPQGTLESHMIWTRPIRRMTRLQTRQKFNKPSLYLGKIRIPRTSRRARQCGRKARIPPKQELISPRLPASRKRDGAQPSPVFPLAIRAGLDGRVDVPAACEGGQRCGEVCDVLLEGIGDLCGKIGGVIGCVGVRGSGEGYRPRYSRTVG